MLVTDRSMVTAGGRCGSGGGHLPPPIDVHMEPAVAGGNDRPAFRPQQVLRDPRCDLMVAEVRRLFDLGDERGDLVEGQSFACGKPPEGGAVGGRSQISWRQAVFGRVRLLRPPR